jgi:hypothetical protein
MDRLNKSFLVGLGHFNTVGAQQTTILPKIFVKKPAKGKSMLERQLAAKSGGVMDTRKLRAIEDIHDRYQLLTREQKIWQQRRRRKSVVGNFENDRGLIGFSSTYGIPPGEIYTMRQMTMPCEVIDIGVENITLKPIPYSAILGSPTDDDEGFVQQEDGFQLDLLNFSVGGAQIRGGETQEANEAFLKYLVGDAYDDMNFEDKVEALLKNAIVLRFYPVLTFIRSEIQDYEPILPFCIPVIARVARFRASRDKENEEPRITSIGVEYVYNPMLDNFSRDTYQFDKWEQITAYTENAYFIEVHKSLQLLFGFDRAMEEQLRDGDKKSDKEDKAAKAAKGKEEAKAPKGKEEVKQG